MEEFLPAPFPDQDDEVDQHDEDERPDEDDVQAEKFGWTHRLHSSGGQIRIRGFARAGVRTAARGCVRDRDGG